jgi:hypothetical protein
VGEVVFPILTWNGRGERKDWKYLWRRPMDMRESRTWKGRTESKAPAKSKKTASMAVTTVSPSSELFDTLSFTLILKSHTQATKELIGEIRVTKIQAIDIRRITQRKGKENRM